MEIDYSAIKPPQPEQKQWNKAPRHVYFGPKDPNSGEMLPEPQSTYAKYPSFRYKRDGDKIMAQLVEDEAQDQALPDGWTADLGALAITAPSFEQALAMKAADEGGDDDEALSRLPEPMRRKPGRPRKE